MAWIADIRLLTWLLVLAAYLLGSVSGARLLGHARGINTPTPGSVDGEGIQPAATRGWRFVLGVGLDVAKGALAAWLALRYAPVGSPLSVTAHGYLAAFAALAGHVWPVWYRLSGGKGASTLLGGLLVMWPLAVAVLVLGWMAVAFASGYLGLATVVAALLLPLLAWTTGAEVPRLVFAFAACALMVWAHRGHLAKLRDGTESRFARARLLHRWRRGP
ncbi:glycerol-3-phosphate acyltransferase [Lysobacter sp. A3-1-A15]|uniref:glycerol-3-phosphate acyltransferase n=1 Tax=Novilysobacter viscosus TaxID=3098602 RepID=UPI002EDBA20A